MTILQSIPVSKIKTRGTNPRTLFEEQKLNELAENIKVHGILQPLVVRPVGSEFELIAGERRLRAAKIAKLTEVPATVRELTDLEADEIQVVENAQRVDLNYVEEADAFDRLRRVHGLDLKQVANKTGKPAGYINYRLQLVGLSAAVRKAALERNSVLTIGYASLIAKINDHAAQGRFLAEILKGDYNHKPLRLKEAEQRLEQSYQIPLTKATFNTNDAELLASVGACASCPFNTTNLDRTIYKDKEICTKPTCFREKETLRFKQIASGAKEEGLVVIQPKKTSHIFDENIAHRGEDGVRYNSEFVTLDESSYWTGHKPLRSILKGDDLPQQYITQAPSGRVVYLVRRDEADAAIARINKAKSRQQSLKSPSKTAAQKKYELNDKAGKQASRLAVLKIVEQVEKVDVPESLRKPLSAILNGFARYFLEEELIAALKRREILVVDTKTYEKRRAAIKTFWEHKASKLDVKTILGLCIETSLGRDHYTNHTNEFSKQLTLAAELYKVDPYALKKEELKALQANARAKATKKKAAKKTSKGKTKKTR